MTQLTPMQSVLSFYVILSIDNAIPKPSTVRPAHPVLIVDCLAMLSILVGSVLRSIEFIRTTRRSARPSSSGTCIAVRRGHHLRRMVGSLLLLLVQMLLVVLPSVAAAVVHVGRNMSLRIRSVN